MKERPILFSAPMIRAILDGRKTQTRRVVKPQPPSAHRFAGFTVSSTHTDDEGKAVWASSDVSALLKDAHRVRCPYGAAGDRLWVREAWNGPFFTEDEALDVDDLSLFDVPERCAYKADGGTTPEYIDADDNLVCKWCPSIHMPRWASRILLEVTDVRVERLQEISEADARAEGASYHDGRGVGHSGWRHDYGDVHANARSAYARLWKHIHGPGSWDANPWVWVVEFRRVLEVSNG